MRGAAAGALLVGALLVPANVEKVCHVLFTGSAFNLTDEKYSQGIAGEGLMLLTEPMDKPGKWLWLLGKNGFRVHSWRLSRVPVAANILRDGHVLVAIADRMGEFPEKQAIKPDPRNFLGFMGDRLLELDWNGNEVWALPVGPIHHFMDVANDGRILVPSFETREGGELAVAPKPGYSSVPAVRDTVLLVRPGKGIEWEWRVSDHFSIPPGQAASPDRPLDYFHLNRAKFVNSNPITGKPAVLISLRNTSTLALVAYPEGKVIWSVTGLTSQQHDPTLLDNGNILVFDNGNDYRPVPYSRVVEIDPRRNQVVWEIKASKFDPGERTRFYSPYGGFAVRKRNGNTLIVSSEQGLIFEVAPDNRLVGSFVRPYYFRGLFNENYLFPTTNNTFIFDYLPGEFYDKLPLSSARRGQRRISQWVCGK